MLTTVMSKKILESADKLFFGNNLMHLWYQQMSMFMKSTAQKFHTEIFNYMVLKLTVSD